MNLVEIKNDQPVTTSLQVAEVFEKQHKHVLEAIDELIKGVAENSADLFMEDTYIHPQNKQSYRQIIMTKKGWTLLAMGFTGSKATKFKLDYINAFEEMEKRLNQQIAIPQTPMQALELMFQAQHQTESRVHNVEKEVEYLKSDAILSVGEYALVSDRVKKRVSEVCNAFGITHQKGRSKLFADINSGIKVIAGVGNRSQLRKKHFEMVMKYVNNWEPSLSTKMIIDQLELDLEEE